MIVGMFFEGDEDRETALRQHDAYPQALGAIIEICNRLTRSAKALLGVTVPEAWGSIESCDHRTLQAAHDLLAAVWRFRHDQRQGELALERRAETLVPHTPENMWLWWLRDELESWVWEPQLVREVQLILLHQNQPIGYEAESRLCLALIDRFPDVPWRSSLRDAFEQALEQELAKQDELLGTDVGAR